MVEKMNEEVMDSKELQVGDVVTGSVTKVEEKQVLVNVGYKTDGVIPISELANVHIEKASDVVELDQTLELKIIKLEEDDLVLSKRAVDAEKAWVELQEKFTSGHVFDVTVKDIVNGGLVVDLGVRGFIPASLVEVHYVEDFTDYKGKTLAVKIVELDREKNRVILSHKAVVELELDSKKKEAISSLKEGDVVEGTVQRLTDFGAFVNVGGVDGLVHISQISHERVEQPSEVLEQGQKVKVKVLSVDADTQRISLSIKAAQPGPWENVAGEIKAGDIREGVVKRLVTFGAFVEILPGVEGLVHVSQIANRHVKNPNEVLEMGQEVKVKVLEVHVAEKRISLSIKEALEENNVTEDYSQYEPNADSATFQLSDIIGEQLKKLKK
ncbi:TPA: 30S ribosomal protein S1 [Bacillus thuringiensis]|jgi:small subunit ribosomal protein S1|uniref:Small ribosomal subunit protein bS1 homolog n=16 Tax=Bacillus cereus group TaxID=86661 RepID=A0A9X0VN73_BACTU|nr:MULTISPECIES: 30S ribosomal protein S1 [Bacillus]MBJ6721402.1 30S ribosomal protein S1 [Bacillus sp. PR5]MCO4214997.1 30S ribosomal protein S1 [Bacillus sp. 10017]MCU7388835.1 30S ribosomal protein S1 [Bacillus sp. ST24]MCX2700946.1 30S ribosomal protein S1 [Bacillus sp. AS_5]MDM5374728.1 30S ribosomal protein S1 [Bacillus bombysepticus]MDV8114257.1 30S ribosomal protein S1 [Bacillus sp. BAU-SS-2023]MEB4843213.1 30S ribosomal protein S1 [Paenibacillus jamilae]NIE89644.1 30S ribosomal pro